MKKFITLLMAAIIGMGAAMAGDRVTRDINVLPAAARTILNTHFKKVGVNHIKVDESFLRADEYEVILNDGTEIDFDKEGRVKEVDCGTKAVPSSLIMKPITTYVARHYKKARIVGYEVKSNGYEIELNNGIDLKFDRSGAFRSEER